jgi:hypothetical protein
MDQMQHNRLHRIGETMASIDNLKMVTPPPGLWERIQTATRKPLVFFISKTRVWAAAACFVVLAGLNTALLYSQNKISKKDAVYTIVEQYELTPSQLIIE